MYAPTACTGFRQARTVQRREFLRAGALSLFGLGLPHLLRGRAEAGAPRPRARACIVLFMWGGPAQQDTWDLKPPLSIAASFDQSRPRFPACKSASTCRAWRSVPTNSP
jgi:Protein of unknown function (DUF1501)